MSPGGEPEPSEAEFRADKARLLKALEPFYGEDAPAPEFDEAEPRAELERAQMMEDFCNRHRRRAEQAGMPVQEFLDEAARLRAFYEKAHVELEEATEMLLQVQSNRADASVKLIESIFQVAVWLKRTWPAMDETAREQWGPVLKGYEESRERWLAVMSIEDRRRLEEICP